MNNKEQKISDENTLNKNTTEQDLLSKENKKKIEKEEFKFSFKEKDLLDEKILFLEKQLIDIQTREKDSILRAKAEMENLRRRTEQDIEKAHKFALERFIHELLPVIDSLDRAVEISEKIDSNTVMSEGIKLTLKSMLDVLSKFGVEVINDSNVPLDPNVHQAISIVESKNVTNGNILSIVQKGYTLNGRVIRAAMVTVAKS